ncbi:zincin [Trichodelitschia bisporula]|uniref:Zincin n=1 Tax=Trichodelitschia bisporula TaxID=703511 RepID=A0A6G1HQN4_9PEZI|nr:zincin [Trichodelitschia bisporula]
MDTSPAPPELTEKTSLLPNNHVPLRRTCRSRLRNIFLAAGASILTLHLLAGTFYGGSPSTDDDKADICLTDSCIHASSEILYNLSPNYKELDPCTNFEELVCGGWRDRHDLRPDQDDAFTGTIMAENSQTLLRHILEAPYPNKSAHSGFSPARLAPDEKSADEANFDKMKSAYEACLNVDTIKEVGLAPLKDLLLRIVKIFPASGSEDKAIQETVLFLAKLGISALVSPGTGPDDKDPDTVVVAVSPPYRIGLPAKENYEDDKIIKKYEEVITTVMGALYPDKRNSVYSSVVELEKKLAAASPSMADRQDITKSYHPMTLKDAAKLTPEVGLSGLIANLVPAGIAVDKLVVTSPDYMAKLSKSILSSTSSETLQSYFLWKTIQSLASYVDATEITPYKRFVNELQGKDPDSEPERWRTCVGHVDDGVGWILSRFFIERAFSAKAKQFGDRIVTDIKDAFIDKLKATKWMEDSVTELAIDKVHNIVQKIGYPTASPDIMDPEALRNYYASLDVNATTFFKNALAMRQFEIIREWAALGKPVDRNEWGMTAGTVNAYYNPPGNEIVFPAGIMQFPVFDVNIPAYLSYGAFGSVAGHELSHAFDSTGRHYDQHGNYTDWWTNATVAAFQKRADCFVEQYGNFSIDGPDGKPLHVNGKLTLGENIADAGGLAAAFQSWRKFAAEKPAQDLPGLDYFTQDQMFFINYSGWWCGKSRPEAAVNRIFTDPHAPKWARILGTMANSRDFRKSFNCPVKEPVCELW